jgi:DNA invertase Pin-like site-specific DNA recombinase
MPGKNGKRLGRPQTAALQSGPVRKLFRAGVSKAEIARRLSIGRTSVRRILKRKGDSGLEKEIAA